MSTEIGNVQFKAKEGLPDPFIDAQDGSLEFVVPFEAGQRTLDMQIESENRRDDFTEAVKRTISLRVGTVCSNPECRKQTYGPQEDPAKHINIGVAAHITAASPGGPRYEPSFSSERRGYPENGIWLCQNCAKLVDNDSAKFPADLLRGWKQDAEREALSLIGTGRLAATRSDSQRKLDKIRPWIGKEITKTLMNVGRNPLISLPTRGSSRVRLYACDEAEVIIGKDAGIGERAWTRRIPLSHIDVSYDDLRDCLMLCDSYT